MFLVLVRICSPRTDIKNLEDWYKVTVNELKQVGGGTLFSHYGSMSKLLTTLYPEYLVVSCKSYLYWFSWDTTKFRQHISQFPRVPQGYWDNIEHQRNKLKELSYTLSILLQY